MHSWRFLRYSKTSFLASSSGTSLALPIHRPFFITHVFAFSFFLTLKFGVTPENH
jgi:hypothetical protein